MDSVPPPMYAAVGAVLAALIAGAFSYFNLIASKEIKVSEFRQAWIDALRNEIAVYISRAITGHMLLVRLDPVTQDPKTKADLVLERSRMLEEANYSYHAIQLRINKHESNATARALNSTFVIALDAIHSHQSDEPVKSIDQRIAELSTASAAVLKFEWNRVRDGEPTYKRAKTYAIITMGISIILLGAIVTASVLTSIQAATVKVRVQNTAPHEIAKPPQPKASLPR